ncbi:protein BIG GRAIN 1-like D [Salvia hispanica]|uniref:protein BIG GRAIN 1-like D n=1 Tax=Salvia hispanica TaxID=49212 RepID=UPI0020098182|nr:protein BIG GRAIN 1-like D [Salvia hispanica]
MHHIMPIYTHPKAPSFSSSLLDAIYHDNPASHRRTTATKAEDDIESLRRAMLIEKWMQTHSTTESSSAPTTSINKPKPKKPISPAGKKISNFFNSIFSPRNFKSSRHCLDDDEEWTSSSMRKSRSMKDAASTTSRSCLTKNASLRPAKSVRFLDQDKPKIGSHFIKKNIDSFRVFERKFDCYESTEDDMSCGSSDLFELENIDDLPVYETTSLHHSIGC